MAAPWTSSVKKFDPVGHSAHVPPQGFASGFIPPILPKQVWFGPATLFASMARCAAAARVASALNHALFVAAKAVTEAVVDDVGNTFDVLDDVTGIADFQRSGFTGSVGNGVCDICMNVMGYVWRDLSSELITTSKPLGDFIYQGGPTATGQVVLSEAKGSFAGGASVATTKTLADDGYKRQVHDHLGSSTAAGTIVHGYAVALRANTGTAGSAARAFAHIAESLVTVPASAAPTPAPALPSGADDTGSANARLALGNYRTVFHLLSAPLVIQAIDAVLRGEPQSAPDGGQEFYWVEAGGRPFLVAGPPGEWEWWAPTFQGRWRAFLIAEQVAVPFLNYLSGLIESRATIDEARLTLPVLRLELAEDQELPDQPILFRDGLAFSDYRDLNYSRVWLPRHGLK
jgi:hypothetical protein